MASKEPLPGKCGALITKWEDRYGEKMYCSLVAGQGTDHKGTGRCKYHGGKSTGRNGITRTIKEAKTAVIKAVLHGDVPGYRDFKELPPHLKYDLDLELYGGKQVAESTIKKLLEAKDQLEMTADSVKLVLDLAQLLVNISEHNRRNVDTQFKIKYSDISKFQVQFIHMFIETLVVKIYNDDILEIDNSGKRDKLRKLIAESLAECSRQGGGEGPEVVQYSEINENVED